MDGETLRDGIFALHTRRFGSVAECMVRRLGTYAKSRSQFHDLFDDQREHRIEVKFSRVQKQADTTVTEETVLQCIEEAAAKNRLVEFAEWKQHRFDCNIQQVKRTEFDVLYYGLFFAECVQTFRITSQEIMEGAKGGSIYYSDFHHKGNKGEGQFHVSQKTLQHHLDHYHYKSLTYDELYKLLARNI
ncbi:MAG: hypothetical protein WD872_18015 [Pirellulaceae bacterium]